jgi:hypothetical protein
MDDLENIVRSATTAGNPDRRPLTALMTRCWPGGGDRSKPVALDWVRRWGPHRITAPSVVCGCDARRCAWCN